MTKKMTINHESARTRNPLDYITPQPSVPAFMEHSVGACSILQRDVRSPVYHEKWVGLSVHRADYEEGASPIEVDAYMANREGFLDMDVPEPIHCHEADVWGELSNDDGDPHFIPSRELRDHLAA